MVRLLLMFRCTIDIGMTSSSEGAQIALFPREQALRDLPHGRVVSGLGWRLADNVRGE